MVCRGLVSVAGGDCGLHDEVELLDVLTQGQVQLTVGGLTKHGVLVETCPYVVQVQEDRHHFQDLQDSLVLLDPTKELEDSHRVVFVVSPLFHAVDVYQDLLAGRQAGEHQRVADGQIEEHEVRGDGHEIINGLPPEYPLLDNSLAVGKQHI